MKFNRLTLIEKIKANKERAQAEYEELKTLWDAKVAEHAASFEATQRERLEDLLERLFELRKVEGLWSAKQLAKALNPGVNPRYYNGTTVDYLAHTPARTHLLARSNGEVVELNREPSLPDFTKNAELIRVLESTEDEFVTTSGLESLGFRNISYIWQ